ncbi:MAG: thioredoxin [Syntrophomonadaceae bacterium]|nr:thioredoxin [Syntrophomonadaceae bacterium]
MRTLTITKENFESEVINSKKPVLLDFWAEWCGPCRILSPVLDEVAREAPHSKIGKVNVDEQPELAAAFGIRSIPTLALVKDGRVVQRKVGVQSKASILAMLNH